ncbi:hypothetical protein, partial [Mesorhizobium sp. M0051]|uniref:hypothetical protein n=1 Tax=Mesorhizobium sp. M0051 TaxID=2956862 RepID=UPI00333C3845
MEIEEAREVRTTCPYCGVGCGVLAKVAAGRAGGRPRGPQTFYFPPRGRAPPPLLLGGGWGVRGVAARGAGFAPAPRLPQ